MSANNKAISRVDKIVAWRNKGGGFRRRLTQYILVFLFSFDLPPEVEVCEGVHFRHNATGSVIHKNVVIESGAWIHQGVTLGSGGSYQGNASPSEVNITIKRGATIGAGAVVLCSKGNLTIGENAIVGANSVVTKSIPDNEVWVGVPARFHKTRETPYDCQ